MKMKTNVLPLCLAVAAFLALTGCSKNFNGNGAGPLPGAGKQPGGVFGTNGSPDVYVAGSLNNQACYWKNGQVVLLPGGYNATGIVVSGTDVYVCGTGNSSTTQMAQAKLWKNGVVTNLSDGSDYVFATGIAVSGTDVYVAATGTFFLNTAMYWKNGVKTFLGTGHTAGIVVSNGDVYIPNLLTGNNPTYWKNGTLVNLPGNATQYVNAVAVQGANVYVAGVDDHGPVQVAQYWKNGVSMYPMTPVNSVTNAMAIAVSATGTVALAGTYGSDLNNLKIAYWPDALTLQPIGTGIFTPTTVGVAISGSDIYVCGTEVATSTSIGGARYWKNGTSLVNLTTGGGFANAITVVP